MSLLYSECGFLLSVAPTTPVKRFFVGYLKVVDADEAWYKETRKILQKFLYNVNEHWNSTRIRKRSDILQKLPWIIDGHEIFPVVHPSHSKRPSRELHGRPEVLLYLGMCVHRQHALLEGGRRM